MYVTSGQPCSSGPLPNGFGDATRAAQLNLTQLINAAQGAFDLSVYRPDLNPAGMPWGTPAPSIGDWLGNLGDFAAGALSVAIPLPGKLDGTTNGVPIPGGNGNGSPSNPRVIEFPYCTPQTTAQRYTTPQRHDACGGTDGLVITSKPQAPPPTLQVTPPPAPAPVVPYSAPPVRRPSGDLCADLRDGFILQSQVPMDAVYDCSTKGYVGVAPSPLDLVQMQTGMGGYGMGSCNNPDVCAGNPLVSESPADRARRGGDGMPLWMLVVVGVGLYAATKGNTKTKTGRGR